MFENELNEKKMLDGLWFAQQQLDIEIYCWLKNNALPN